MTVIVMIVLVGLIGLAFIHFPLLAVPPALAIAWITKNSKDGIDDFFASCFALIVLGSLAVMTAELYRWITG